MGLIEAIKVLSSVVEGVFTHAPLILSDFFKSLLWLFDFMGDTGATGAAGGGGGTGDTGATGGVGGIGGTGVFLNSSITS